MTTVRSAPSILLVIVGSVSVARCVDGPAGARRLTVDGPVHLERHLDAAAVVGAVAPADVPTSTEWHFDEPQEEWRPIVPWNPGIDPVGISRTEDALRVALTEGTRNPDGLPRGGIVVQVPDWDYEDLAYLVMRARTSDPVTGFRLAYNRREGVGTDADYPFPFDHGAGGRIPVVSDGTVQTYRARLDYFGGEPPPEDPIRQIGLWFAADIPASIDILSIALVPKVAEYGTEGFGSRDANRGRIYRQAAFAHTPARFEYRVRVPEAGRLDFAMGVLRDDRPVTFRITALADGSGDQPMALFEEAYAEKEAWGQRSVDLGEWEGRTVTLGLEAEAEDDGRIALWGAPTLTRGGQSRLPNVIFYVFDGGAADFMSVYGYNRRTTPVLERLAEEGVVFERAYSNSSWTLPSTASFMTSLHTSVTKSLRDGTNPLPDEATTMAEHMHGAGYHTAVFTGNPNAGTLSGLQRGVDVFREDWEDFSYFAGNNHRESSRFLNEGFWGWRGDYPSRPFWAHFQTTDTHEDFPAVEPFAGRFVGPAERERWREWDERLREAGGHGIYSEAWQTTGISRTEFFSLHQGLYDEAMAHNDHQLGRLVERLKAVGEWENTLLIIGGDHSTRAAMDDMVVLLDSLPPRWGHPMFRPTITRVPLLFVWPGRIEGGRRIDHPVSMIDVLPTLLDLVGLPPAEIGQGQSLAPLLLGREGWEPRPVILDEFYVDSHDGQLSGLIEVVDGRWGASLEINPDPDQPPERRRPSPLLLYDLWRDPMARWSVHDEWPDLVRKYTAFLEEQFAAHTALSRFFSPSGEIELTPEQLQTLRTLGYIR